MTLILDGKLARAELSARLKEKIKNTQTTLCLAIIQIGEKEESSAYIKQKVKFATEMGVFVEHIKLEENVSEKDVIEKIDELNENENVNGIIVQLPIPNDLSKQKIIDSILPKKDVDGLTSFNSKKRKNNQPTILPATARGVMELLDFYKVIVFGKKVAVLGRSILAGGPLSDALRNAGGKVIVCHSQTPRNEEIKITKESDIIVVAIGKPKFLTTEFFTVDKGQVVVDVGINRIDGNNVNKLKEEVPLTRFVGDVDFENVLPIVGAISPVPGGVGQMTVLALFENLVDCVLNKEK